MPPFGFWMMPWLNLTICAVPKAGSSMNRQVVAKAAGLLDHKCFYDWNPENDKALASRGIRQEYSSSTTNIVIVRDPFLRAVSSFSDQIDRGYIGKERNLSAFLHFLDHHAQDEHVHHTGRISDRCIGYQAARFDQLINLDDVTSFAKAARKIPEFGRLVNAGWEHCTGGEPSLYMVGSIAPHRNRHPHEKKSLCTPESIEKVCHIFKEDYKVYRKIGHPFDCSCDTRVRPARTEP